jgi:hypothetical protein
MIVYGIGVSGVLCAVYVVHNKLDCAYSDGFKPFLASAFKHE